MMEELFILLRLSTRGHATKRFDPKSTEFSFLEFTWKFIFGYKMKFEKHFFSENIVIICFPYSVADSLMP